MNYLSLLKTLFIFLSLALYVSIASSQEEKVTVTIIVTENGEVTIVREPSETPINLEDITEEDIIDVIWRCNGSYHQTTLRYVDGDIIVKRYNGKPIPIGVSISFEQFMEVIEHYLDKIKEALQCSRDRSKKEGFCKECEEPKLSTKLISFITIIKESKIYLEWITGTEKDNAGYHLWRAIANDNGNYVNIMKLLEFGNSKQVNPKPNEGCSTKIQGQLKADNSGQSHKLISAIGNSVENTCYSFTDISNLDDGTYYYLLEDIGDNGKSIFHCDYIDAVTIGQGPAINLKSAINYCKEVTGSND